MSITAYSGPLGAFGQAPSSDYNPQAAASFFFAGGMLLDPDLVREVAEAQQVKVKAYREQVEREKAEARGEFTLPFPDDDEGGTIHDIGGKAAEGQ